MIPLDIHRACGCALGWLGDIQQASWCSNGEGDFLILQRRAEPSFQCLLAFGLLDFGSVVAPETRDEDLPRKWVLPGAIFSGSQELCRSTLPQDNFLQWWGLVPSAVQCPW